MTFGQNVARIRKGKKWTQKKLAEKVGVIGETISKYERNHTIPNVYTAYDIACALRVPLKSLLK